jgi:acetylornithine deacetylase/succinyl-diaminopimelate desuccinylase-like protein
MNAVDQYIEKNRERFLQELFTFLRIPSVSANPSYAEDVFEAAQFLKNQLIQLGADHVEVCPTDGYPIVFGEKIIDPSKPTVLVYGHYDVQPADPFELWTTPPFEPSVRVTEIHPQGAIFARGACDDKGQMFMHLKAFEAMMQCNALPCNIKFLLEGEEEVGSVNLGPFVENNADKLKADVVLISDTGMISNDVPSITMGLRGLSYVEVEVTGPNRDLHSGLYGGAVANPINALCEMIASLKDENGKITIPGFYEKVEELSNQERQLIREIPFSEEEYKKSLELTDISGEKGYHTMERAATRPSLDVNGIWGGYTGEGAKTVIASKAFAKISMRLVPHQTPDEITQLFKQYFESIAPQGVTVEVRPHHGGFPAVTPIDSKAYAAASKAIETTYGKTPLPVRSGGSIPIVAMFEEKLGIKTVMLGFGLDSDAIHSPNEHYGVFNFYQGIKTIPYFFENFAS